MTASMTDGELGRVLLTLRGVQWILGTRGDPYALLLRATGDDRNDLGRQVRDRGPLYWSSAETWVTADHEAATAALTDPRLTPRPLERGSARCGEPVGEAGGGPAGDPAGEPAPWDVPTLRETLPMPELPAALDRAEYRRLHHWAAPVLGEKALRRLRPAAERAYRSRASALGERFDLVDDLIRPATTQAARLLIGVPERHADRFATLCAETTGVLDATLCPPRLDTARRYGAALPRLHALLAETVRTAGARRVGDESGASPGLAGRLLAAPGPGGPPDVLTLCALLALVGIDYATTLAADAVALLLDHPDQWRALREDPGLAPACVAETLRCAPPVRLHRLYAEWDLEFAGTKVARGEELVVLTGAAHRDPRRHTEPDRFDIHRHTRGDGLDGLLAGPLDALVGPAARLAAEAALRACAAELPELARTGEVLRRLRSPITGGVLRFPAARTASAHRTP
ncbi:P450-derived glycosyltransferase activator [Streptomyces sp. NPDC094032]|uniref:cytochrome P450 family protein n=1 Tax=Streptomyces sp. NPDC094032 TaxID=3155308 RepID=UPI00331CB1A1